MSARRHSHLAEERVHRFLGRLHHLGWGLQPMASPQTLGNIREPGGPAAWMALALPNSQTLILLGLEGSCPGLAQAFRNFEDFSPRHRAYLRALRDEGIHGRYVLMLDGTSGQLIDAEREEVLFDAPSPNDVDERLLPLLDMQALARGSLTAYPRKPSRQRARELAEWTRLWSTRIGARFDATQGMMTRFFTWLHLARLAEHEAIGPKTRHVFEDFAVPGRVRSAGRFLEERFEPLHARWFLLQEGSLRVPLDIAHGAAHEGELDKCLASYALLSATKFEADVIAEALADDDLRLLSWRSSIVSDLPQEFALFDDEQDEAFACRGLDFDFDRHGYVALMRVMDLIVERVRRAGLDREAALERGERPGAQLDLLSGAPPDVAPTEAVRHVLRRCLRVHTAEPARALVARTAMLARACEWHGRFQLSDAGFPRVDIRIDRPAESSDTTPDPIALN